MDIKHFVLTGGPCGGKSTALTAAAERFRDYGFQVFTVPEIPTELFMNGVEIGDKGMTLVDFQEQAIRMQFEREERYREIARRSKGEKKIIFYDRALMDFFAYTHTAIFLDIIRDLGFKGLPDVRDPRYHAVFHLVTAADGAEEFYTLANNKGRKEKTVEEAREVDLRTQHVWIGHPHLRVIDNSTDFEGKKARLIKHVSHSLGMPVPLEVERKYLLKPTNVLQWERMLKVPLVKIDIEQIYLTSDASTVKRIRRRGQNGVSVYYYEEKKPLKPGVRMEIGKIISEQEYVFLSNEKDIGCEMIKKERYCFLWQNQYFELDIFLEPERHRGLTLLEIELTEEHDVVTLPPFLDVEADVTEDERFTNYALARKE